MKKGQRERVILFGSILLAVVFAGLFLAEKLFYPVAFKVCDTGYTDCHTVAKFHDRDGCETTNEEWGWYCDKTDKNNIICQEKDSGISTGYCD